ncbi:hypothetical protein AWB74_03827 [Caballeronia arvi]|uniref:Uncharacterized protein n=1 Tax=Caballeronia arvi TaxID=1777135 RepID=A0A158JFE3_9BURK|nr:hypothetical protein [Caballeronia arvi]SAL67584.1 hypothetical protein AWB74_03827 [Caballeronia arvi]
MKEKKKAKAATNEATRDQNTLSSKARNAERPGWTSILEPGAKPGYRGPHHMTMPNIDGQARAAFALTGLITLLRLLSDEEQATQAIYRTLDHWELSALFGTLEWMARDALVAIEEL